MDKKELIKNGILNQFAALFREQDLADIVLDVIDFPEHLRPEFPTNNRTLGYWREICNQIEAGVLPTGTDLLPLVEAAAQSYPNNPIFSQYSSSQSQPSNSASNAPNSSQQTNTPTSETQQTSNDNLFIISIQGRDDPNHLLASAKIVAPGQQISPEDISLRFSGNNIVLLGLNHCSSEAVASFAGGLQTILQSNQNSVRVNVLTEDPQPYLISRIFVEGPDQARFA
ncbi:effector-associated domain EAD1-containing protein, partial [Moorena sp. SIO4G3]|uniref:effector-associated domain EAD1-containing protein n=1 Tax=Moorena sp. SIO4G3 TaxID=2607821 RepID=UPI00142CD4D6